MVRLILSLVFFAGLAIGVGFLLSGDDQLIDWLLAGGLFGIALIGELTRLKIRRSRAQTGAAGRGKNHAPRSQSSGL